MKTSNDFPARNFNEYILGCVQVTPGITISNITPSDNLLLNSYFENPTVKLHILYVFNMHTNLHANLM